MKSEKLDDDALLALLQRKEDAASHYVHGQLGSERETALREYYRMPYGNESDDGWSQIVASDVSDSVEWILPALLKTFSSTDKAVSFEPQTAADVQGADQATDACNYVFYRQNNGFLILYTAIKDMLTVRNCAVMWRKETKETVSSVPFKGATPEMLTMLLQEQDAEIEQAMPTPIMGPDGQPQIDPMTMQPVMGYTGRMKKTEKRTIVKVDAFSPEDLLVDREWTSPILQDCPYVSRLMRVSKSDLAQMGFKLDDEDDLEASDQPGASANMRLSRVNSSDTSTILAQDDGDESTDEGWLRIEYVLADRDGDGIAERLCVYRLDSKILKVEVVSHVPIATSSPILNTHRWDGQSVADLVSDLQKLHSEILRQSIDNLKLTNNPRTKVLTDANWSPLANIDDLLDSRIGGIIRMRDPNAISEQVTPFAAGASMPMLEYVQGMRENRTGVSRTSMGLNPDSLNNTATGRTLDQSSAMQRIELIARIIAETLVKPIFQGILKVLTEGDMQKMCFRLRDEFVEYDPNEWRDQYDMTINVGLGTGDTMQKAAQLQSVYQMQMAGMPMGLATPKELYHTASKIVENSGFKDVQNFVVDPSKAPPQPPQPPLPLQIEQMKIQADAQKHQAQGLADAQKFQAQAQIDAQDKANTHAAKMAEIQGNLELQAANDRRDSDREMHKADVSSQLEAQRIAFDKWKAELDSQTKIYIAQLSAGSQVPVETNGNPDSVSNALALAIDGFRAVVDKIGAPKTIIRGPDGRAAGIM